MAIDQTQPERLGELVQNGNRARLTREAVGRAQLYLRGEVEVDEGFLDTDPLLREGSGDQVGLVPTIGMDDFFALKAAVYAEFFGDVSRNLEIKDGEMLGKTAIRWDQALSKAYLKELSFDKFCELTFGRGMYERVFCWSIRQEYTDAVPLLDQLTVSERRAFGDIPQMREWMLGMYRESIIGIYQQLPHTLAIVTAMTFANSVLAIGFKNSVKDQEGFLRDNLPKVSTLMQIGSSEFTYMLDHLVDTSAYPQQWKRQYVGFDCANETVTLDMVQAFIDFVPESGKDAVHRRCPMPHAETGPNNQPVMDDFFDTIVRMYVKTGALSRPALRKLDGFMK